MLAEMQATSLMNESRGKLYTSFQERERLLEEMSSPFSGGEFNATPADSPKDIPYGSAYVYLVSCLFLSCSIQHVGGGCRGICLALLGSVDAVEVFGGRFCLTPRVLDVNRGYTVDTSLGVLLPDGNHVCD